MAQGDKIGQEPSTKIASCVCGKLRVSVFGAPAAVNACSCLACQRRTGAAFSYTAFFPNAQVSAIDGESRTWRRSAHSGGAHDCFFCPICGAAVYIRLSIMPDMIAIPAGCFADPDFPSPGNFYWTQARHRWFAGIVGVPDKISQ